MVERASVSRKFSRPHAHFNSKWSAIAPCVWQPTGYPVIVGHQYQSRRATDTEMEVKVSLATGIQNNYIFFSVIGYILTYLYCLHKKV